MTAAAFAREIGQSLEVEDTSFTFVTSDEFERYVQVFEKLGSGGHSTVYSAKWNDRQVALKIMHDDCDRITLQSEIEIMRAVNHPSIVKIYGACSLPMCLMLQIVHGGSLHEVLHCSTIGEAPLAEDKTLGIARDIASAMTYLHELSPKIIHRDLKPQNILIEQDTLRAILSDFGVSRAVRTSLSPNSLGAGTVNYMAPELFEDGRADEKVDVYSFAMILCETLTGKQPWKGIQPVRIASRVLGDSEETSRPPLPSNVSEFTTDLVRACWHRDPNLRPSFRQILTALDRHIPNA
jgi:serine/threonine protein kinase